MLAYEEGSNCVSVAGRDFLARHRARTSALGMSCASRVLLLLRGVRTVGRQRGNVFFQLEMDPVGRPHAKSWGSLQILTHFSANHRSRPAVGRGPRYLPPRRLYSRTSAAES